MQFLSRHTLLPGDRVSVSHDHVYRHVGIVSRILPDGTVMVISASKRHGCVVEQTLAEFSGGRVVRCDGLQSHLSREIVVARFRQMLGQPWSLQANCEHYASMAEGKQPSSPQLVGWCVAGLTGLLLYAASRRSA